MTLMAWQDPNPPWYPESDGQPMAENTQQYDWLVKIKENLEILLADRADAFVAGDLFWYPDPNAQRTPPMAPDVLVVLGRPKGARGSYRQWEEDGIAPQVVFEIRSPANRADEMAYKRQFYEQHGVEEYYVYDPHRHELEIYQRQGTHLQRQRHLNGWISPRLRIRFALLPQRLELYYPNGEPFYTSVELAQLRAAAVAQVEQAVQWAKQEQAEKEQERARAARLAERLRALGIDPDQP
jgi:Uma2 family endonuclease